MTLHELKEMPVGVIEERILNVLDPPKKYYLVKNANVFYISFCENAINDYKEVDESLMLHLINNENLSNDMAIDIYYANPQNSHHIFVGIWQSNVKV